MNTSMTATLIEKLELEHQNTITKVNDLQHIKNWKDGIRDGLLAAINIVRQYNADHITEPSKNDQGEISVLPCPFCGGMPWVREVDFGGGPTWQVRCMGVHSEHWPCRVCPACTNKGSKATAIEEWNMRYPKVVNTESSEGDE